MVGRSSDELHAEMAIPTASAKSALRTGPPTPGLAVRCSATTCLHADVQVAEPVGPSRNLHVFNRIVRHVSTWATVKKLGKKLPAVEESTWFRTPSLKVGKRSFVRLKENDVIVVLVDLEEKELLLRSEPETFFTTPHYDGYPAVLVRLSAIEPDELAEVLQDSWCRVAPKRLLKAFEEGAV